MPARVYRAVASAAATTAAISAGIVANATVRSTLSAYPTTVTCCTTSSATCCAAWSAAVVSCRRATGATTPTAAAYVTADSSIGSLSAAVSDIARSAARCSTVSAYRCIASVAGDCYTSTGCCSILSVCPAFSRESDVAGNSRAGRYRADRPSIAAAATPAAANIGVRVPSRSACSPALNRYFGDAIGNRKVVVAASTVLIVDLFTTTHDAGSTSIPSQNE